MKYNSTMEMLEFSKTKVVGKVVVELNLVEDDISAIIDNAFDGSIGYWAGVDNRGQLWDGKPKGEPISTWATKLILEGSGVKLYDVEGEEDDESWTLTLDKLIEGYKLNYINRPHDNDIENGDATTYDCIIQYALFGEVVFG